MVIKSLKLLFSHRLYTVLAIFLATALFITYFVLNNFPVFASDLAIEAGPALLWKVFANQVGLVWGIAGPINVFAVGIVSLLAGLNISLLLLRRAKTGVWVGRPAALGFLGTFGGAFSAACSACNTALISLLGVSGGLAVFPFRGLEISLVAIALLSVSTYYTSRSLLEFGILNP